MNSEAIGKLAFNVAYNVNARFPIPVTDIVYTMTTDIQKKNNSCISNIKGCKFWQSYF